MRILHLEDSDNDATLIFEALRHEVPDCQVSRVETRQAFLEALKRIDWDIILADYSLPSFDGISALKLAVELCPDIPFIFVSGCLGEELAVASLKNGATDHILKHRLERLPQAVIRASRESEFARANKEADRRLKASLLDKELLLQEVRRGYSDNLRIIDNLLRTQAELESKAAEIERFTYTMSHDLKGPLTTIKNYISAIDHDLANGTFDSARSDLQRVAKAADRMQVLIEEVLTLLRIGRVENTPETVAFASLVEEALELVAGAIQEKNIHVAVAGDLPSVTVDRSRMVEVLQNLIDNAAKFMGSQAAPAISIGASMGASDDATETCFFVKDNGVGVEARHHARIFGLFDQLNPKTEGSGAGLAIVKRIIELHGGRIWVESPPGGAGSTFWFTLKAPRVKTTQNPAEKM